MYHARQRVATAARPFSGPVTWDGIPHSGGWATSAACAILPSLSVPRERRPPPDADSKDEVVVVPIEDHLDLHTFRPRDIPGVVQSYLEAAAEQGFREVRLIHGRGTGFQRRRVREVLAQSPWVASFSDAPPARGGWGATLVWLSAGAAGGPSSKPGSMD